MITLKCIAAKKMPTCVFLLPIVYDYMTPTRNDALFSENVK